MGPVKRISIRRVYEFMAHEGTEGRNPFEVFMLMWATFVGISLLLAEPSSGSVQSFLEDWMVIVWAVCLCFGGSVGLVGVYLKDMLLSLLTERASMFVLFPASVLYAIALFATVGTRATIAGSIIIAFSAASCIRLVRIYRTLRTIRKVVSELS